MPLVIGIDEAGYGPNLGPLVQASAVARVPAADIAGWNTFQLHVRRAYEPRDARCLIDDSKKAFARTGGEADVRRTLSGWLDDLSTMLARNGVADSHDDYQREPCRAVSQIEVPHNSKETLLTSQLQPQAIHYVSPSRLNAIIAETDSKATALARGYVALVNQFDLHTADDEVIVIADKMGGRHYYAGLVQEAFPCGWVTTERESPGESRYRVHNMNVPVTAIFRPKADATSIAVALASLMAKCVREMAMGEFNAFWAKHVPDLAPTAGYPVDAKRYYVAIEPSITRLNLAVDTVWRRK